MAVVKERGTFGKVWGAIGSSAQIVEAVSQSAVMGTMGVRSSALAYAVNSATDTASELGLVGLTTEEALAVVEVLTIQVTSPNKLKSEELFSKAMAKQAELAKVETELAKAESVKAKAEAELAKGGE
jgi:hypothetical protein